MLRPSSSNRLAAHWLHHSEKNPFVQYAKDTGFTVYPDEMAKDFDAFSCVDWWNSEDGTDSYCKEGYGALVAHGARDLEVRLSTRVQAIDWSGSGVTVRTDRGRVRARACIVTVSTGVLAALPTRRTSRS